MAIAEKQSELVDAIEALAAWAETDRTVTLETERSMEPTAHQSSSAEWFRQDLLPPTFGISTEAARKYRSGGLWLEGKHWRKDPANRIVYSRSAIEAWMGGQL